MKATVMESNNGLSVILTEDGMFRTIPGYYEVGSEINYVVPLYKNRKVASRIVAAAACLFLMLSVGFYSYENLMVYATVTVQGVTPIQLELNRKDRVVGVRAIEEEGEALAAELLDSGIKGTYVKDAVAKAEQVMARIENEIRKAEKPKHKPKVEGKVADELDALTDELIPTLPDVLTPEEPTTAGTDSEGTGSEGSASEGSSGSQSQSFGESKDGEESVGAQEIDCVPSPVAETDILIDPVPTGEFVNPQDDPEDAPGLEVITESVVQAAGDRSGEMKSQDEPGGLEQADGLKGDELKGDKLKGDEGQKAPKDVKAADATKDAGADKKSESAGPKEATTHKDTSSSKASVSEAPKAAPSSAAPKKAAPAPAPKAAPSPSPAPKKAPADTGSEKKSDESSDAED